MTAYYNEIDPYAAQWLRNLIAAGHIAPGDVDERSIADVRADDLRGYQQCHFFAGIGVWSYALRLAGWPDDREVWTGSCPCQPFSAAGKGEGYADERHLWPHWHRLIRECRPVSIFGEQVDAAIRTGWLDDVSLSLEELDYAVGAVSFPACSVGAPHIRQRLYFVAYAQQRAPERHRYELAEAPRGMQGTARQQRIRTDARDGIATSDLGDADQRRCGQDDWTTGINTEADRAGQADRGSWRGNACNGFWRDAEWLPCIDGKARPVEPGTFPLAHGATQRVGRLRAYGNAIVAPQAEEFIRAYMSACP